MIVRLMGEGQYELDQKNLDEINKIDNEIVKIVNKGDEKTFKIQYKKLTEIVRKKGTPLANEILKPSDVIIPPAACIIGSIISAAIVFECALNISSNLSRHASSHSGQVLPSSHR